jgi:hypothetical protein
MYGSLADVPLHHQPFEKTGRSGKAICFTSFLMLHNGCNGQRPGNSKHSMNPINGLENYGQQSYRYILRIQHPEIFCAVRDRMEIAEQTEPQ